METGRSDVPFTWLRYDVFLGNVSSQLSIVLNMYYLLITQAHFHLCVAFIMKNRTLCVDACNRNYNILDNHMGKFAMINKQSNVMIK